MTTLEAVKRRAEKDAKANGYYLASDKELLQDLFLGLQKNEERYGYPSCPCRLASEKFELDNIMSLLVSAVNNSFQKGLKRKPRLNYKKQALNNISNEDIKIICDFLEQYLTEEISEKDLIYNLILISKTGRKK